MLSNATCAAYTLAVDDQIEEVKMREKLRRGLTELEKRESREILYE
jgi:hypothetical protein